MCCFDVMVECFVVIGCVIGNGVGESGVDVLENGFSL